MLMVISPAKKLDYEQPSPVTRYSQPQFLAESQRLINQLKQYSPQDLARLMHLSDPLASLNAHRYATWQQPFTKDNAKACIFAFKGDVYEGMQADTLNNETIDVMQARLRILSGLYGILRPLDLMQAYRLEMGTKLVNERGKNLYEFWGDLITQKINADLVETNSQYLINLASNEYFKSVNKKLIKAQIITPIFKDWKNGQYKIISFYAKKARGLMTRYLIEQSAHQPQQSLDDPMPLLLGFESAGYQYNEAMSKTHEPVFIRRMDLK
ncbi:MAG: peroxide stress protein YaaA [bacterium]